MPIDMQQVESSNIDAIGYDHDENILVIRFKSGTSYQYDGVPHNIYLALVSATSVGKAFISLIKDKFTTTKL